MSSSTQLLTPPLSTASTRMRPAAMVAVAATGFAAAAIMVAGILDPGYSAWSEAGSALASRESSSAPIMIAGFFAMALALLAAGRALFTLLTGFAGKTGAVLLMVSGLLTVVEGLARQDCSTLQQACLARESAGTVSGEHVIHNLVALPLFAFLVVSSFLFARSLRRAPGGPALGRLPILVAVATLVFLVWFGSGAYGSAGGAVQRVFLLLAWGWPVFLAVRLSRGTR